jgi:biopolymer transport protein ExbD
VRKIIKFREAEEDSGIDITPMLDVVFIMLIFFIVTASFVKESGTEVLKPQAENAQQRPKATIMVAVDADNDVWIDRTRLDVRAVKPTILRMKAENPESDVMLQADETSKTETVMKVVDGLREAGIPISTIATTVN